MVIERKFVVVEKTHVMLQGVEEYKLVLLTYDKDEQTGRLGFRVTKEELEAASIGQHVSVVMRFQPVLSAVR